MAACRSFSVCAAESCTRSRDVTYAGRGALLTVSVDPPLSPQHKWYGRGVVDGYWLSDPMPCAARQAYLAGGWLRPGAPIEEAWLGPLETRFFDQAGRKLTPVNNMGAACRQKSGPRGQHSPCARDRGYTVCNSRRAPESRERTSL